MGAHPSPTALNEALLDAVTLFERLGIRYALVGGIAAMYYGRARFTDDLDFVPDGRFRELLGRRADAMRSCRFDPTCTFKLYHENGIEVDLLHDEFAAGILDRSTEAELAGRRVRIAAADDLVAMKLRAGRPQDDYDISEMIKAGAVNDAAVKALVDAEAFDRFLDLQRRSQPDISKE